MKQVFLVGSLLALFMAATWPLANAEPTPGDYTTPEAMALRTVLAKAPRDSTNDPKWRASLAAALRRYCESVLVQVPRNTPQEDRWVDDELNDLRLGASAGASDWHQRMARVEYSLENARKSLRHVLSECSSIAGKLIGPETRSPAAEALLWVRLSGFFSVEESIWRYAEIVGLGVSQNDCRKLAELFERAMRGADPGADPLPNLRDKNNLCHWGSVHHGIMLHAVIPLLEAAQ
jgi:hypothetical protein